MKLVFLSLLVLGVVSCGKQSPEGSLSDGVDVVATTTMIADMVRVIGGNDIRVEALMRPGVDPHLYKASPADMSTLNRAKVIFYNGLLLEGKMERLFTRLAKDGKQVHAVAEALPKEQLLEPDDTEGHPDPHIWGDASLWAQAVPVVVDGLSKAFPENAEGFAQRGDAYREQLESLHQWAQARLQTIPEGKRKLVTSHDAFAYFGRAYQMDVIGVQGISTASEPSVADRTRMVDFIKVHQIPAIFVESSVNATLIEQIGKDANVTIGGELFSDAMGEPGVTETVGGETYDVGTYVGMLKHNVNTVVKALTKTP